MKKTILFLVVIIAFFYRASGQDSVKIVYIVDSVPVIDDPADGEGMLDPSKRVLSEWGFKAEGRFYTWQRRRHLGEVFSEWAS
jgi:hypothetical protein